MDKTTKGIVSSATVKKIFEVAEDFRPSAHPIKTPIQDFDDAMDGGVREGEMITISGLSGHGKTSFALWLTKEIVDSGIPCLWFSYEMNPWYLKEKLVGLGAKEGFDMYIPIEHSANSDDWLEEKILEAKNEYGCKVIFIDHLHYLIPPNNDRNASLMIGGIARKIKQLAIKTDTIIYLIAHMRKLETGEKVNVDAVRDSALIINESDYVYLIERIRNNKKREDLEMDDFTNYSKVNLAKNRRTGKAMTRMFRGDFGKFVQMTPDEVEMLKKKI